MQPLEKITQTMPKGRDLKHHPLDQRLITKITTFVQLLTIHMVAFRKDKLLKFTNLNSTIQQQIHLLIKKTQIDTIHHKYSQLNTETVKAEAV